MLLNADCVFTDLLKFKILTCEGEGWKVTAAAQTAPYICKFFVYKNGNRCIQHFQITVKNGIHCLFSNAVECLLSSCNSNNECYIQDVLKKCRV